MARPRKVGETATCRFWLRLTPSQRAGLHRVAQENRSTVAAVVKEAIDEFVADYAERQLFSPFPSAQKRAPMRR